ncbi:hypothetical protein [Gemella sp. zg-1178]|uniref:hypothetical protein n=1 Tax=Gemella sp. zg-1178 TaxID=2840372 RepID=UPI001C04354A|nr:hypothetical protein [Gemella sp. zg-1178]MBU0279203.1 hypothetical protein [Gemella sp. zg-1178]
MQGVRGFIIGVFLAVGVEEGLNPFRTLMYILGGLVLTMFFDFRDLDEKRPVKKKVNKGNQKFISPFY